MKKADEIREKFAVKVAVLIERQGVLYLYRSDADFLPSLLAATAVHLTTPLNFITLAEAQERDNQSSPAPSGNEYQNPVAVAFASIDTSQGDSGSDRPPRTRQRKQQPTSESLFELKRGGRHG